MAKGNTQNLKRGNPETQFKSGRRAAEMGRKGGIQQGINNREKKLVRDYINDWLENEQPITNGTTQTGAEIIANKLATLGIKNGNIRAIELLLALAGQKPAEKVIVSDIDNDVINEVERMVESGQKTSD